MAESYFATFECELMDRLRFKTQAKVRMAIFEIIEGRYKQQRPHSALGQQSPVNYESSIGDQAVA